jgi:hypothetical protein
MESNSGVDIILNHDEEPIQEWAKDGREFDQDLFHGDPRNPDEVEVIQYVTVSGRRRRVLIKVSSEEIANKAEDLILTCEVIPDTTKVAITARKMDEGPEHDLMDIADNAEGERSIPNILENLINQIHPD